MYRIVRLLTVHSVRDDGRVKFCVYDQNRSRLSWVSSELGVGQSVVEEVMSNYSGVLVPILG